MGFQDDRRQFDGRAMIRLTHLLLVAIALSVLGGLGTIPASAATTRPWHCSVAWSPRTDLLNQSAEPLRPELNAHAAGTRVRWGHVLHFQSIAIACIVLVGAIIRTFGESLGSGATALTALAMFSPLVATGVSNHLDGLSFFDGLAAFRLSRSILLAMLLPVLCGLFTILASALMPGATLDLTMRTFLAENPDMLGPDQLSGIPGRVLGFVLLSIPQAVLAGSTINAIFAFGEEVGWRGWLQHELAPLGFWRASLVGGVLWGIWHAPLILLAGHNFEKHRIAGAVVFIGVCVAASPMLAFVREAGGSVWMAAIFHGVFNGLGMLPLMFVQGNELLVGMQGLAGMLVFGGMSLVLFLWLGGAPPT